MLKIIVEKRKAPDRTVHAVIRLTGRKPRHKEWVRAVCARPAADMMRLAPHHTPAKEPEMTCDVCVAAVTALNDLVPE